MVKKKACIFISGSGTNLRSIIKIPFNIINNFNKFTNYFFGLLTLQDYLKFKYSFIDLNKLSEFKGINLHLCQSYYAYTFLKKKFINVAYLSDYQREEILQNFRKKKINKSNIICYSNKSNDFVKKISNYTNYKMIELKNLNSAKIIKTR